MAVANPQKMRPTKYCRFQSTVGSARPTLAVLRKLGRVTTILNQLINSVPKLAGEQRNNLE